MSDSELSDAPSTSTPPDEEVKESLRRETRNAVKAGGDVTVRAVRDASADALGLPPGFYTTDKWKAISKELIREEHERAQNVESPLTKTKPKPEPKPQSKSKSSDKNVSKPAPATKTTAPKRPPKRQSPADTNRPRKKIKPSLSDDAESSLSSEPSDIGYDASSGNEAKAPVAKKPDSTKKTPAKSRKPGKKSTVPQPTPGEDEAESDDAHRANVELAASDSEMSVVLDDAPAKQRRTKSKEVPKSKSSKTKPGGAQNDDENDPDKEEIKQLQGWLVKCGVRKVWGKELKPYETSKAKIKHLRGMLTDVGMTGRFSNDKASQIKEARELAADIEAVQEGAQRWGKSEDEAEDDNRTRGGRRVARGAKHYDFLSSDGEETE